MLLRIKHVTRYHYAIPVYLGQLTLRLRPRSDPAQTLLHYGLTLDPSPAGASQGRDAHDNDIHVAWFDGPHDALVIHSTSEVVTLRSNPFDFVVTEPGLQTLPVQYPVGELAILEGYRRRRSVAEEVFDFAHEVATGVEHNTTAFLATLADRLSADNEKIVRDDGPPWPPEETLRAGRGACRDLTVLYVEACRALGLAARFVSGYKEGDAPLGRPNQLHAWAEVYLTGAGWRGFDPSLGLAAADRHVAVAVAADPAQAAPVSGTYWGSGVEASLSFEIEIEVAEGGVEGGLERGRVG